MDRQTDRHDYIQGWPKKPTKKNLKVANYSPKIIIHCQLFHVLHCHYKTWSKSLYKNALKNRKISIEIKKIKTINSGAERA